VTKTELYTRVVVNRDIPSEHLQRGDVATLVDYVEHPKDGEEGVVLEIFNALGESISIVTVPVSAIESLPSNHIPAVRVTEQPT